MATSTGQQHQPNRSLSGDVKSKQFEKKNGSNTLWSFILLQGRREHICQESQIRGVAEQAAQGWDVFCRCTVLRSDSEASGATHTEQENSMSASNQNSGTSGWLGPLRRHMHVAR